MLKQCIRNTIINAFIFKHLFPKAVSKQNSSWHTQLKITSCCKQKRYAQKCQALFFFLVFTIYMYLYIYFKVVHCTEAYSASYAAPCKYSHTNYCSGCPAWTHVLHTGLAALNSHPEATQPFPLNKACITQERIKLILHTFLTAVL